MKDGLTLDAGIHPRPYDVQTNDRGEYERIKALEGTVAMVRLNAGSVVIAQGGPKLFYVDGAEDIQRVAPQIPSLDSLFGLDPSTSEDQKDQAIADIVMSRMPDNMRPLNWNEESMRQFLGGVVDLKIPLLSIMNSTFDSPEELDASIVSMLSDGQRAEYEKMRKSFLDASNEVKRKIAPALTIAAKQFKEMLKGTEWDISYQRDVEYSNNPIESARIMANNADFSFGAITTSVFIIRDEIWIRVQSGQIKTSEGADFKWNREDDELVSHQSVAK